jgi:hypothetical protein|tara:strand:- start:103 stop:381 length:279 start_codon:yes stop_codon:yes gene_type:complete
MARYPELPKFIQSEADAQELYNFIQQWGAALINELDTRDIEVNATPSTNIYAVATVGTITRPRKGDIAYSVSTGKFKGYVSLGAETSWQDLN